MKMRSKFLALLLAVSMTCSAAACGSADDNKKDAGDPVTKDTSADNETDGNNDADVDIYAAAQEKMKEIKSLNGKMTADISMTMSANGESQSLDTSSTVDMSCFYDPVQFKADISMDAGEAGSSNMTMYAEASEDGTYTMYISDGANWQSQSVQMDDLEAYDAAGNITNYMQDSYHFQDAGTEQVDGKAARKYTGVITGDDMQETVMSTGVLDSLTSAGLDTSQLESMFQDLGDLPITLWIDEAEYYPVKYEMDMTEMMNSMMSNVLASMGDQAEGVTMEYTKAQISMTCSDYNAAADFTIPDEAKAAATPAE
ncbi:MAG: hypothetical protein HFH34_06095 [Eubacterium sp.]|jgi:hypothetical protein|nr:hypothetical protein [Eubacterium sp.]